MTLRGLRQILRRALYVPKISVGYVAFALSFLRGRRHILRVWPEEGIVLGSDVALFIHYDKRGGLGEHVLAYLRELNDCGFAVVFITNSGRLQPSSFAALQPLCRAVVIRRNVGYDFGAIREALDLLALPRPETARLLIANDSVYGPLVPLARTVARVNFDEADLWGATESWQIKYHLQSYFLLVGRRAMTNPAWVSFWRSVRQVSSKEWVIAHYEVGLTQRLLRAGLRCQSLWRYQDLIDQAVTDLLGLAENHGDPSGADPIERDRSRAAKRIRETAALGKPMNPTAELWRHLLLTGFPFIKAELLRENPVEVGDIADWRRAAAGLGEVDIAIIERDLQRKMRNRAP